ncbi:MAG: hypothetical protein AAF511_02370 [Pseudomonadota bacterium]
MKVFDCFVPDFEDYAALLTQLQQVQTQLQTCHAAGETLRAEIASRDQRYLELVEYLKHQHLEVFRSLTQGDEVGNVIRERADAKA